MQSHPTPAQVEQVQQLMAEVRRQTRAVPMRMPGGLRFQA
jgi:hypothetical protein